MDTEFKIGDTIEFTRVKRNDGFSEFETISGEVVNLPNNQIHLTHLVCIKRDNGETRSYKRADMIALLVLILG